MTLSSVLFAKKDTVEEALPTGTQIIRSQWLGDIETDPQAELFFPAGLPGFEEERRILPVEIPSQRPLVYLQSLRSHEICFVSLPVFVIDPGFRLSLSEEERYVLELPEGHTPVIGADVLCLALLVPCGQTVRVNLNAPIVINLNNARGVQCVPEDNSKGCFRLEENGTWGVLC
jgi:flagellar assembly factor FliW